MIINSQQDLLLTPRKFSNLSLWIDVRQLALADNDSIVELTDFSTNGNHGTQSISGNRAIFKSSVINGLPVARFDGSNDMYSCGNMFASKPSNYTIFCVHKFSDLSANRCVYSSINTGGNNNQSWCYSLNRSNNKEEWSFGDGVNSRYGNTLNNVFNTTNFAIHTQRFTSGSTEVEIWKNSTLETNTGITGTATTTNGTIQPFIVGSLNGIFYYQGDIAELIVYNTNLSNTDRLIIETYLKTKYAL